MQKAGKENGQNHQLWRNDNHPIELYNNDVIDQKTNYIHNNPVVEGIVENVEDYLYSSAKIFMNEIGLLELEKY